MVMMMVYDVGLIAVKNHNCWLVMSFFHVRAWDENPS